MRSGVGWSAILTSLLLIVMGFLGPPSTEGATSCTLWDSTSDVLTRCPGGTFPTTCAAGESIEGFDPADGVKKVCVGGTTGGTFQPVDRLFTHATDCLTGVLTAQQGNRCLDLDNGQEWLCQSPAAGGDSTTLCDDAGDWVGGKPIWLDANGRLLYYPTSEATAVKICEDATEQDCHLFYIDGADGLRYKGKCAGGACDVLIQVETGQDLLIKYGTTDIAQMLFGTNDLRATSTGWINPRSGTAAPTGTDCDVAGEAGRVYIETDQADGQQLWICDGTAWRQQGLIEDEQWFDAAGCNNATAGHVWDAPTANAANPACEGTNTRKAVLEFDGTTDEFIDFKFRLPTGYSSMDFILRWKSVTTTSPVAWCVQLTRVPLGSTSDPSLPAQATGNCVSDAAAGTTLQENEATIASPTCTSCVAGDLVYGRVSRDPNETSTRSDTLSGDALLLGWTRIMRRAK